LDRGWEGDELGIVEFADDEIDRIMKARILLGSEEEVTTYSSVEAMIAPSLEWREAIKVM
jgi:hypothetical protein